MEKRAKKKTLNDLLYLEMIATVCCWKNKQTHTLAYHRKKSDSFFFVAFVIIIMVSVVSPSNQLFFQI